MNRSPHIFPRFFTAAAAISLCALSQARASDLTWDASGTNPANPTGGAGTWDTTTNANWSDGITDSVWDNADPADTATFLGTTSNAAITLAEPIIAAGITFGSQYIISNGANVAANTLTLTGSATVTVNANSEFRVIITGTSGLTVNASGSRFVQLNGNNFAGVNTYTGVTTISSDGTASAGGITIRSLQNGGIASGIGASSSAAENLVFDGGFLRRTAGSSAISTDRLFTLTADGGGLVNNTTNVAATMNFTSAGTIVLADAGAARTFYLGGSNTGDNTFAPSLGDSGTGATSLTKIGAGKWILAGVNTYTGDTAIGNAGSNGGTLALVSGGELRFKIQDADVSNQILLTGAAGILELDGLLRLDISGLSDAEGTWNLVDVDSLSTTFGANFGLAFVGGPSFTNNNNGTYSSGNWSFDTSTGNLVLAIPEPSPFVMLFGGAGVLISVCRFRRTRA